MIFNISAVAPSRPQFTLTIDGTDYRIDGMSNIEQSGKFKYQINGQKEWKLWVNKTAKIKYNFITSNVAASLVGCGARGGWSSQGDGNHYGGGGGKGGQIKNVNLSFTQGETYDIKVDNTGTSVTGTGINESVGVGGGANGGGGGVHRYSSGSYSGPGKGSDGSYAFGKESFDGVKYAPGGGGGSCEWSDYGTGRRGESTDIGAGGHGGHNHDGTNTQGAYGNPGIFMLWSELM